MKKSAFYYIFLLFLIQPMHGAESLADARATIPVIYSTDLFHPPGDMDDQVDLAVLNAIPNIDIRAVILDAGKSQKISPGAIPVAQISHIAKRKTNYAIGLANRLQSPKDKGLKQGEKFQKGVELIIDVLKKSHKKVTIITVGSLRDVAAAFNRRPVLFFEKVKKVLIFAGEASKKGFKETNVKLDTNAFLRIMRSDLPIYWVPCFDGGLWKNKGRASYWRTTYAALLEDASSELIQYFIYAYKKLDQEPIKFLYSKVNPNYKRKLFNKHRNLWGSSVFVNIIDMTIGHDGDKYKLISTEGNKKNNKVFDFVPIYVRFSDHGDAIYGDGNDARKIMQFRVINRHNYNNAMTEIASKLLSKL